MKSRDIYVLSLYATVLTGALILTILLFEPDRNSNVKFGDLRGGGRAVVGLLAAAATSGLSFLLLHRIFEAQIGTRPRSEGAAILANRTVDHAALYSAWALFFLLLGSGLLQQYETDSWALANGLVLLLAGFTGWIFWATYDIYFVRKLLDGNKK